MTTFAAGDFTFHAGGDLTFFVGGYFTFFAGGNFILAACLTLCSGSNDKNIILAADIKQHKLPLFLYQHWYRENSKYASNL